MSTPPQWHPDPQQPGQMRFWDGTRWTEHTAPTPPAAPSYGGPAAGYSAPSAAWAVPSSPGQWGAAPQVYYATGAKHGKRFWWTLGSVGAVIGLLILGAIGVGIWAVVKDVAAPERAARGYLADLTDGRYPEAYARLCVQDTTAVSLTRFTTSKRSYHPLSYSVYGADVTTSNGVKTAVVHFDETTTAGGDSGSSTLDLVHVDGSWEVCHLGRTPDQWASVPAGTASGPALSTDYRHPLGVRRWGLSG